MAEEDTAGLVLGKRKKCGFMVVWLNNLVPRAFPFCVGEGRVEREKNLGNEVAGFKSGQIKQTNSAHLLA